MLLLCLGPDTFRAQEKARDLEVAFKQKYDFGGSSTEHVLFGKDGVDEVIERATTLSLFCSRRFIRASSLLSECPKAKQAALVGALTRDPDHVIVVDVESEPLSSVAERAFQDVPKITKYSFPIEHGKKFEAFALTLAERLKIPDQASVVALALAVDGDSWLLWNELLKLAAGGASSLSDPPLSQVVYPFTDAYLRKDQAWTKALADEDLAAEFLQTCLHQSRAALRVRDGATGGLHPFLVSKMKGRAFHELEAALGASLAALFSQRAGYGDEIEASTLLGLRG